MDSRLAKEIERIKRMGEKGAMPILEEEPSEVFYIALVSGTNVQPKDTIACAGGTLTFSSEEQLLEYCLSFGGVVRYVSIYKATLQKGWVVHKKSKTLSSPALGSTLEAVFVRKIDRDEAKKILYG